MSILRFSRLPTCVVACVLGVFGGVLSGCGLFGAEEERVSVRVQTGQEVYAAESAVGVELINGGEAPVYRAGCPTIVLQELRGDTLSNEWTVAGFEYCGGAFAIDANESYRDTVFLKSGHVHGVRFDDAAEYRLDFVGVYRGKEADDRLGEGSRLSNRFTITQP
jgi:hypothetical protein